MAKDKPTGGAGKAFDDLARKLAQVPKKEAVRRLRQERKRRAEKKQK
jgi:hypothetical protein